MGTAIEVKNLAYTYPGVDDTPGVAVFKDLSLQIEEGTFVAILGSNGCGKSTLAKHFNTILLPCGGSVSVFGLDTSDEARLIQIRRTVGMANVKDVTTIADEAKRAHAEKVNILCGKDYIMNRTAFKTGADFIAAVKRADEAAK